MSDNDRVRKASHLLRQAENESHRAQVVLVAAANVQATLAVAEELRALREAR